jgi:hypothetical protein
VLVGVGQWKSFAFEFEEHSVRRLDGTLSSMTLFALLFKLHSASLTFIIACLLKVGIEFV